MAACARSNTVTRRVLDEDGNVVETFEQCSACGNVSV